MSKIRDDINESGTPMTVNNAMTQLNRDELVEKIAIIIWAQDPELWKEYATPGTKAHYRKQAEAVLKAIGECLPSVVTAHENIYKDAGVRVECGSTAYELYTQFKDICEGK